MKRITLTEKDMYKGNLILVNQYHLIHDQEIQNTLEPFNPTFSNILFNKSANRFLQFILTEISAQDKIVPVSGYRSLEEQEEIFNTSLQNDGYEFTSKYVALPNASEHQTGLAIDLGLNLPEIDFIRPSFPRQGICNQFRHIAIKNGFIERYKKDKEAITNISAEEWHFRYVGHPHAKIMSLKNFCLEEYIAYLKNFKDTPLKYDRYEITYLPYQGQDRILEVDTFIEISGNNIDGFIITRTSK